MDAQILQNLPATSLLHGRDSDCNIGKNGCCVVCGVEHGAPCPSCGGTGFHTAECPTVEGDEV